MASTFSDLKIELIGTGEQAGIWGNTTNSNLGTALEEAIVGRATANFTSDANLTLTLTNTNATQVARHLVLNVTSGVSLTVTRDLIVPAIEKPYIIQNNTTGAQSIRVIVAGTGVTIPNGKTAIVYNNGTDVGTALDFIPSLTLGAALPVASGGTSLTTLTANNVIIGNGTSAPLFVAPSTSGNILTSNGTTWTSAVPSPGGIEYVVKTANYTTQDKEGVLADTSGGAFTVTLPISPATGAQVVVADSGNFWGTNNLTIGRNGELIGGLAENLICDITGVSVQLVYDGASWEVYAQIGGQGGSVVTLDGTQTLTNKTLGATTLNGALSCADQIVNRPILEDYAVQGSAIGSTGATATIDMSVANFFSATVDEACVFTFSNPPASGDFGVFVLELTDGGDYAITFPASVDFVGGVAPTLSATGVDQLVFTTRDGGTTFFSFVAGLDIKSP